MSGSTARLGLYQIGGGSSNSYGPDELVDADVLDHNNEKIDAAVGATPCTSGSRPTLPYDGQLIRETDTKNLLIWVSTTSHWTPVGTPNAASDSLRDALFPTPAAGDRCYRSDKGYQQLYTGTAWVGTGGLTPVIPTSASNSSGGGTVSVDSTGLVSFTAATAVLINGIFSADFRDYQVVIDIDSRSAAVDDQLHFTAGGVAQTDAVYARRGSDATASTVTVNSINSASFLQLDNGSVGANSGSSTVLEVSRPFDATKATYGNGQSSTFQSASVAYMSTYGYTFQKLQSLDGLHIFPATAGTLTGTIRVLGRS